VLNVSADEFADEIVATIDQPQSQMTSMPTDEFQQRAVDGATSGGQNDEYPFHPTYGSATYRYLEQLYANEQDHLMSPTSSSSSTVPTLPPLHRSSSYVQLPSYQQQ
jgi:hypothetical protein